MIGEGADVEKQFLIRTVRCCSCGSLDISGLALCKRGDHSFETRRWKSSPHDRSGGQGVTRVEDNEDSTDPDLGHEDTYHHRQNFFRFDVVHISFSNEYKTVLSVILMLL